MAIKLQNITKSFNGKRILNGFSVELPKTGVVCFTGASGSGKTTLLRIIAGLTSPDSGTIIGIKCKKIAMVFQEDRLLKWCTSKENIAIVSSDEFAENWLARMELSNAANKRPSELSGGMRRRVAFARALAFEGDILILDEPFKGLDEELKNKMLEITKQQAKERLVLLVTHDSEDISKIADMVHEIKSVL